MSLYHHRILAWTGDPEEDTARVQAHRLWYERIVRNSHGDGVRLTCGQMDVFEVQLSAVRDKVDGLLDDLGCEGR